MTAAVPLPFVEPTPDERELLLRFLNHQRDKVVATTTGLTDEQARARPNGRLIALSGIVNHLTHVEWRWIDGRYLRQPVSRREEEFHVGDDRRLADLVDAYRERARATDRVVREAPGLDVACDGRGDLPGLDLRFVVVHLIEETAHHAGHADATREMLDGATGLGID